MSEFRYAKGRIGETLKFISEELKEFETDYSQKTWQEYQDDRKLQKLIDRTVENILTALIELCGTVLAENGKAADNYSQVLKECGKLYGFSTKEQEELSRLAVHRNRLAHRYLNFRWETIKRFRENKALISKLMEKTSKIEEKND